MIEASPQTLDASAEATIAFLRDVFSDLPREFAVRLWDGTVWEPDSGAAPRFTLVLRHPGAVRAMFWPPGELSLAEAYLYDDYDVEGDLEAVFPVADELIERGVSIGHRLRRMRRLHALPSERRPRVGRQAAELRGRRSSLERDRQAVGYHYNLSNEFFALWLDPTMAYSCAVFASADEELATAQRRKLDYVCRKLRLEAGERLLDVGCGWGGLVLHAVQEFGVEALGVTLSSAQVALASSRISDAGLDDWCRVELRDYREIGEPASFDKIASVGMYEHVARDALTDYFRHVHSLLRPGGVFLAHGIAASASAPPSNGQTFLNTYVFPDHDLVPISTLLVSAEEAGFEVRDVESLREHYVLTTRKWLARLEARHDEACRLTDEVAYRIWRLTLAASAHRFASGRANLYQVLLAKPDARGATGLPLSRADWYA
jgi:cyclopropane-fatty-acyl-phospholipid synthase